MIKDKYLTVTQSAKVLKVSRETIYRWIKLRVIVAEKVGGALFVCKDNLKDNLRESYAKGKINAEN